MRVVLPTMELIHDRKNYVDLFNDSGDDGIRGVIREAVHCYGAPESEIEKLVTKLMRDFDNSYTALFHATLENYTFSTIVEIGIRNLIEEVHEVIHNLYKNDKIAFDAKSCCWIGNDIVVVQEPVCIIQHRIF